MPSIYGLLIKKNDELVFDPCTRNSSRYFHIGIVINFCCMMQDGRIDYGEFVAMMQKGNAGIGRRTMRNSLNLSMRDGPGAI